MKFSASVDGQFIESLTRPYKDGKNDEKKKSDEFYNNLFHFCKRNGFGFHPMVSASGIEYWKDNYKWWCQKLSENNFDVKKSIMFLEVRNGGEWTSKKVSSFIDFLNFVVDYDLKYRYNNNIDKMTKNLFNIIEEGEEEPFPGPKNYEITFLSLASAAPGCTISR